jgi:hypothetical protein
MNRIQFPIPEGGEDQSQAGVQDEEMAEEQEMLEKLAGEEDEDDEESVAELVQAKQARGKSHTHTQKHIYI